jgi:hypothetical protein
MDAKTHEQFVQLKRAVEAYFEDKRKDLKPKGIFDLRTRATLGRLSSIQKQVEVELYDALEKGQSAEDVIKRHEEEIKEIFGHYGLLDGILDRLGGD